jgi:ABC-type iron transport system FetAB ATPase subunit
MHPDMAQSDKQRDAMAKDILLLEAALATDRRIVSLDENTARKYYTQAAKTIPKLREIVWVNPDKPEEQPIEWLQAGAPADDFRMLGHAE